MTALGLIETKGLLAAIEGADAMLKAADVVLLEKNLASGGLVTISIAGEVAAVKAAVDAAVASIQRISAAALVSQHVIPRPDAELSKVLATNPRATAPAKTAGVKAPVAGATAPKAEAKKAEPAVSVAAPKASTEQATSAATPKKPAGQDGGKPEKKKTKKASKRK